MLFSEFLSNIKEHRIPPFDKILLIPLLFQAKALNKAINSEKTVEIIAYALTNRSENVKICLFSINCIC